MIFWSWRHKEFTVAKISVVTYDCNHSRSRRRNGIHGRKIARLNAANVRSPIRQYTYCIEHSQVAVTTYVIQIGEITQPMAGQRTSMLARPRPSGARGSAKAAWAALRFESRLSVHWKRRTSSFLISLKYHQRWVQLKRTPNVSPSLIS